MDLIIYPKKLSGTIKAIPSKSCAHRLLICAAFADRPTTIGCQETNKDIEATVSCLNSIGAKILRTDVGYSVSPVTTVPKSAILHCGESGSTLRFLLPIVGALGVDGLFEMEGRLPARPLSPLWEEMERMGCSLSKPSANTLHCCGKLQPGNYQISGSVSSQFISGLLFASALMSGQSQLTVTDTLESRPYVIMTQQALKLFGKSTFNYKVSGGRPLISPNTIDAEGDWSNAAFYLAANSLGSNVFVTNLNDDSPQGDRIVTALLDQLKRGFLKIPSADIPDLVPILSIAAAAHHGACFTHISRLRLKESDRVASVMSMLNAMGIRVEATNDTLTVYPGHFHGCQINPCNDHRIAMSAAIAATTAKEPIILFNAECVSKSYPAFWQEYRNAGGHYEQFIR